MSTGNHDWILLASAAVQALATVVLVGVTGWYVRLTRQIVKTGQEQLNDTRALLEAQTGLGRIRLHALAKRLLTFFEALPPGGIPQEHLRRSGIWSEPEEQRLVDLATASGRAFAERVPPTVSALSWIRQLQSRIAALPSNYGYGTDQREEAAYKAHREAAMEHLRAIVESLDNELGGRAALTQG